MDARDQAKLSPVRCYKASFARSRVISLLDGLYGSSGQLESHKIKLWGLQPLFQIFKALLWVTLSTCDGGSGCSLCLGKQRQTLTLLPFYKSDCKPSLARNMHVQREAMPKRVWWIVREPGVHSISNDVAGSVFNPMNKSSALPLSNYVENSAGEWNLNLPCCIAWGCLKDFK